MPRQLVNNPRRTFLRTPKREGSQRADRRITRKGGSDTLFSNGWLARYAEDVAQRLLEAKPK